MESSIPKISCLTLTDGHFMHLQQCIRYYSAQTYENKELVIVSAGAASYKDQVYQYITKLKRNDIRLELLDCETHNLGELRNITIELSSGEVVCQWDDDDLYHPERLRMQFGYMKAKKASVCYLTDHLHWFKDERKLYWTDWSGGKYINIIPPTLMMYKNQQYRYPEVGKDAMLGEDTAFYGQLFTEERIAKLKRVGYLSVYVYHGNNIGSLGRHKRIIKTFPAIEPDDHMKKCLINSLSYYNIPPPLKIILKDKSLNMSASKRISEKPRLYNTLKKLFYG